MSEGQQFELPLPFPEFSRELPLLPARMVNEYQCGDLPKPEDMPADERIHARSITLSSNKLGLITKIDLVEAEGGCLTPVDYKRGKRPHIPKGAYDPERVQLCVQGMLLEEHGYRCDAGVIYYAGSRERVRVEFDQELRNATLAAVNGLRLIAAGGQMPPPLEDSPKCPRCSLYIASEVVASVAQAGEVGAQEPEHTGSM